MGDRSVIPRIPVKKIMNQNLLWVGPTTDVQSAAKLMAEKNVGSLLIKHDDSYVGILTDADIVRKVLAAGLDCKNTTVEEIMSYPISSLDEESFLEEAHQIMGEQHIRHLLVTREGEPIGMISVRSLLSALYDWMLKSKRDAGTR
jgi:signal-transduction protein with cAMP-binding, CBS, and nucleotidyltransferase domain